MPVLSRRPVTVGGVDERLLAEAWQARDRLTAAERDAAAARAEFRHAVRRLVSRGSSARDVTAALGLSDQQLHEIRTQAGDTGRRASLDLLSCSFCGAAQREVRKLIAGPDVYICDACVELADGVVASGHPADTRLGQLRAVPEQDGQARCSFCGKPRDRLTGLAALSDESPADSTSSLAICPECVSLCDEIISEELR